MDFYSTPNRWPSRVATFMTLAGHVLFGWWVMADVTPPMPLPTEKVMSVALISMPAITPVSEVRPVDFTEPEPPTPNTEITPPIETLALLEALPELLREETPELVIEEMPELLKEETPEWVREKPPEPLKKMEEPAPEPVQMKPEPPPPPPPKKVERPPPVEPKPVEAMPAPSPPVTEPVQTAKLEPRAAMESEQALVEPRFDADYLDNPIPDYPRLSRRLGEQGTVMLRVLVSRQGAATKVLLADSSGSPRLDEAAQEAVRNWRFVPARQAGRDQEGWVIVPVVFKLEG